MEHDAESNPESRRSFLKTIGAGIVGLCALTSRWSPARAETEIRGNDQATPIVGSVDVHHHILPPEYLKALASMGITSAIGVPFPPWSLQQDLELMDRLGVE